uniref:Death domain-containing protein n=1 Tax=Branchiostoma floridae TaxID=7739 RepID=C3ZPV0_BRAFL|eukprot:XP_002589318.1 hypothetical protein BRAFLDRAFT_77771 [Branchiostoma floridae]
MPGELMLYQHGQADDLGTRPGSVVRSAQCLLIQLLKKHRVELVNNIKDVDSVLDHLVSEGVIDEYEEKEIKDREGRKAQVRKLLATLAEKQGNSFHSFCTALKNSRQKRLAELLSNNGERVFIIHAGEDKAGFVEPLVRALQDEGLPQQDIFYDVLSIGVGDVIRSRIMAAMASESLELVVTVLSKNSLNHKYWPKLELETALRHNKQLFPVWLDDNEDDFQEFNGLVGKYCPTLKSIRGYKVPLSNAREEVRKVAREIVSKLRKEPGMTSHSESQRKRQLEETPGKALKQPKTEDYSEDEDLQRKVDVQKCFDKVIAEVSHKWDDLARKLGFNENQIKGIDSSLPNQDHRCREVLNMWRNREGSGATLQVLKQALIDIGERFTAETLEGNVRDPDKFETAVRLFREHAGAAIGADQSGSESEGPKLEQEVKLRLKKAANECVQEVHEIAFTTMALRDLRTYDRIVNYFKQFAATVTRIRRGCIVCCLDFDDASCYRTFLAAYRDGRLSETLTRELITDDMRAAEGEDLYVHVKLLGSDGECQDDSLSDEGKEPLSPVKTEPPQDLPSCSYSTETRDTKPAPIVSALKSEQPPVLKTELINRPPPFDFQRLRHVKVEPHFHVKIEGRQLGQHSARTTGPQIKTEEHPFIKTERRHRIKTEQLKLTTHHHHIKTEHPHSHRTEEMPDYGFATEHHHEYSEPHLHKDIEYHMGTEHHMDTEQHVETEHHVETECYMDTEHYMDTERHMDTEHYPCTDPPSTKDSVQTETETGAGAGDQQEQTDLMGQAQQQEEPFCYHCYNQLLILADRLGPYWTWLALQLGFTSADVERISSTYHPSYHPHWCLWEWVQRELWGATVDAVLVGLRAAGLHQIADEVETGALFQKDVDDGSWGSKWKGDDDKDDRSSSDGDSDDASHTSNLPTYPTGEDALAWNDCIQDFFKTDEDTTSLAHLLGMADSDPTYLSQFVTLLMQQGLKSLVELKFDFLQTFDNSLSVLFQGLASLPAKSTEAGRFPPLEIFCCSNCHLTTQDIRALVEQLKPFQNLTEIDLSHNSINDEAATGLAEGLSSCQNLKHVHLVNNKISNKGALLLLLQDPFKRMQVETAGNDISYDLVSLLSNRENASQTLEEIDLSRSDLTDEAVPGLAQFFGLCQNLKKVNLSHNKLSDKGDLLPPLPNLEEIDLSYNAMSDKAVPGLAKGVGSCQNLKQVSLEYNSISNKGALLLLLQDQCKRVQVETAGNNICGDLMSLLSNRENAGIIAKLLVKPEENPLGTVTSLPFHAVNLLLQFLPQLPNLQELALSVSCQGEAGTDLIDQLYEVQPALKTLQLTLRDCSLDKMTRLMTLLLKQFPLLEAINLNGSDITDEKVPALVEGLASCQKLKKVNLSHNKLSDRGDFLPPLPNLEEIDLSYNDISDESVSDLAEGLGSCQKLKKVNLSHNKLSDRGDFLPRLPNLEEIDLSCNDISDESVSDLAEGFGSCQNLKHVLLTSNTISNKGALLLLVQDQCQHMQVETAGNNISDDLEFLLRSRQTASQVQKLFLMPVNCIFRTVPALPFTAVNHLLQFLPQLPNLQELAVCVSCQGEGDAELIDQLYDVQPTLKILKLKLMDCSIDKIRRLLTVLLKRLPLLEAIDLRTSGISDETASALAEGLAVCQNLKKVNLSYNKLSNRGDFLPPLPNLEKIYLSHNAISDEAVPGLAEGLGSCQNLKKVNLSYNKLSNRGDFLPPLPNLEEIDLSFNAISDEAVPGLAEGLGSFQNLKTVNLSYNMMSDVGGVIEAFVNLPFLTHVYIGDNSLRDESLPAIAAWLKVRSDVESVWLRGNSFSAEGVRDFVRTMKGKAYRPFSDDLLYDSQADVGEAVESGGEDVRREEQQWKELRRKTDLIRVEVGQLKLSRVSPFSCPAAVPSLTLSLSCSCPEPKPLPVLQLECFDKVIAEVSHKWDDLARKLEFSENQIKVLRTSERDDDHRCREMLNRWRNREGSEATLQVLKQALIDIEERRIAESLEGKKTRKKRKRKRKRKAEQSHEEHSSEVSSLMGNDPHVGPALSHTYFLPVAKAVGSSWVKFAVEHLGLTGQDIHTIQLRQPDSKQHQAFQALELWRDRRGRKACRVKLAQALRRGGFHNAADELDRYIGQEITTNGLSTEEPACSPDHNLQWKGHPHKKRKTQDPCGCSVHLKQESKQSNHVACADEADRTDSLTARHDHHPDLPVPNVVPDDKSTIYHTVVENAERVFDKTTVQDYHKFKKCVKSLTRIASAVPDDDSYKPKLKSGAKLKIKKRVNDKIAEMAQVIFRDEILDSKNRQLYHKMAKCFERFQAALRKAEAGCVFCHLDFSDVGSIDTFWRGYSDGSLSDTLTRELITDGMRAAEGGADLYIHVRVLDSATEDGDFSDQDPSDTAGRGPPHPGPSREHSGQGPSAPGSSNHGDDTPPGYHGDDTGERQLAGGDDVIQVKQEPAEQVSSCCMMGTVKSEMETNGLAVKEESELDRQFAAVADHLGSMWERLASSLGFNTDYIRDLTARLHPSLRPRQLIRDWMERNVSDVTLEQLVQALRDAGIHEIADAADSGQLFVTEADCRTSKGKPDDDMDTDRTNDTTDADCETAKEKSDEDMDTGGSHTSQVSPSMYPTGEDALAWNDCLRDFFKTDEDTTRNIQQGWPSNLLVKHLIRDRFFHSYLTCLATYKNMRTVDLTNNKISNKGALLLLLHEQYRQIQVNVSDNTLPNLQELALCVSCQGEEEAEHINQLYGVRHVLKKLQMKDWSLGNIIRLSTQLFQHLYMLEVLDLSDNDLSDEAVPDIVKCFTSCLNLKEVNLGHNKLTGVGELIKAFIDLPFLTHANIGDNSIREESLPTIAAWLKDRTDVEIVDLCGNRFSAEGVRDFVRTMKGKAYRLLDDSLLYDASQADEGDAVESGGEDVRREEQQWEKLRSQTGPIRVKVRQLLVLIDHKGPR